jgi:hypothetical protein
MRGRSQHSGIQILACFAVLAAAGGGGLAAGFTVKPAMTADSAMVVADISPSDTVNLRFPADWAEPEGDVPPRTMAFASADGSLTLFSPRPILPVAVSATSLGGESVEATAPPEPPAKAKPVIAAASIAPVKMALASVTSKPVTLPPPAARPVQRSNAVLNESQIASVKRRLNLTPDQERYWPAVAAELRKMEYKKDKSAQGSRMAAIDMSKMDVDGLKSAGFPLVMSFNEDQRRELRSLAHLLGLEKVMSGI